MTDDIVARLREVARNAEPWEVGLLKSAANEIERLRARVAELEAERAPAP